MNKNSKHSLTSLSLFFLSLSLDLSIHTQKNRPLEPTTKRCSGASSTGAPRPKGEFKFLCFRVFFFFSSKKETEVKKKLTFFLLLKKKTNEKKNNSGVTNFDPSEYEQDIPALLACTQDELVAALRGEGRRQAAARAARLKKEAAAAAALAGTAAGGGGGKKGGKH